MADNYDDNYDYYDGADYTIYYIIIPVVVVFKILFWAAVIYRCYRRQQTRVIHRQITIVSTNMPIGNCQAAGMDVARLTDNAAPMAVEHPGKLATAPPAYPLPYTPGIV